MPSVVRNELGDSPAKMALADRNHAIETLLFYGSHETETGGGTFEVGVVERLSFSARFRDNPLAAMETFWRRSRHPAESRENIKDLAKFGCVGPQRQ